MQNAECRNAEWLAKEQRVQKNFILHELLPHLPLIAGLPHTGGKVRERSEADEGAIVHGTGLPSSVTAFGRCHLPP